ncbi:glutamate--cysteine ligase [Streptomyces sp. NPDC012623]|uniref:glutamate--cysteine ligase n=1 Tax=unclassified Streptomyces TaxID=2593676 RepID=UPI0036A89856
MGLEIDQETFTEADFSIFRGRLGDSVGALRATLAAPGFGQSEISVGAELEMFLMDADGRPAALNDRVRTDVSDHRITLEVDQFNLEANLTPAGLRGRPFTAMRSEADTLMETVGAAARSYGALPVPIGTLPTLTAADLCRAALTPQGRFHHIDRALSRCRSTPYLLAFEGEEPVTLLADSIAVQGATCSWQLHLVVRPGEFTRTYNAAQLATGPVLAAAGNSPLLLGRRLWHETRIPMYEQGFGDGGGPPGAERPPRTPGAGPCPRASFGQRWLDGGVVRLFADAVREHDVLVPVLSSREPVVLTTSGAAPWLDELRLHQGMVWTWNRPVYDPGGHVRIEFRALPSGPTSLDMAANSAFLLGLTLHLSRQPDDPRTTMPFETARGNFYRAARSGLRARICWPSADQGALTWSSAEELLPRLLPLAAEGLVSAGVDAEEAERLLGVVAGRVSAGQTGAVWQQRALTAMEEYADRRTALRLLTHAYTRLAASGAPVHTWRVPTRSATR